MSDEETTVPHNRPDVGHIIEVDLPHARVTLTQFVPIADKQDPAVEIEVWPKKGQSAFVVLSTRITRLIAERMIKMCDELEDMDPAPSNVVSMAHRKAKRLKN